VIGDFLPSSCAAKAGIWNMRGETAETYKKCLLEISVICQALLSAYLDSSLISLFAERKGSPGAGFIGDPVEPFVRAYFIGSIPRSLHIFLARLSLISVCRGTEERLFWPGFPHQECLEPSLMN
jgi:hypothetical protein